MCKRGREGIRMKRRTRRRRVVANQQVTSQRPMPEKTWKAEQLVSIHCELLSVLRADIT